MGDRARSQLVREDNYSNYGETERGSRQSDRAENTRGGGGCCCGGGGCCCRLREDSYNDVRQRRRDEARARMEARTGDCGDGNYGHHGGGGCSDQATFRRRPTREDQVADPDYVMRRARSFNSPDYLDDPRDREWVRRTRDRMHYPADPYDVEYAKNPRAYMERYGYPGDNGRHYGHDRYGHRRNNGPDIDVSFGNGQFGIHFGIGDRNRNRYDDYYYRNGGYYDYRRYPDYNHRRHPDYGYGDYDSDYGRRRRGGYDDGYYRRDPHRYPMDERYPGDDWMYGGGQWGRRRRYPDDYGRYPYPDSRYPYPDHRYPYPDHRYPYPDYRYPYPNGGWGHRREGVHIGIGPNGQIYGGYHKDGVNIDIGTNGRNGRNYYDRYGYDRGYGYGDRYGYGNGAGAMLDFFIGQAMSRNRHIPSGMDYNDNYGRYQDPNGRGGQYFRPDSIYRTDDSYPQYSRRHAERHGGSGVQSGDIIENGRIYRIIDGQKVMIWK